MQNHEGNKQGSSNKFADESLEESLNLRLAMTREEVSAWYENALGNDIAKELARIDLPLSTYTEFFFNIDLHNLLHFITLRADSHAQPEIQYYADALLELITPIVPFCVEAWKKYTRDAVTLNKDEVDLLTELLLTHDCTSYILDNRDRYSALCAKFGIK